MVMMVWWNAVDVKVIIALFVQLKYLGEWDGAVVGMSCPPPPLQLQVYEMYTTIFTCYIPATWHISDKQDGWRITQDIHEVKDTFFNHVGVKPEVCIYYNGRRGQDTPTTALSCSSRTPIFH